MDFTTQGLVTSLIQFGNLSTVVSAAYVGTLGALLFYCVARRVLASRGER